MRANGQTWTELDVLKTLIEWVRCDICNRYRPCITGKCTDCQLAAERMNQQ